jgi:hypothetical protein
MTAGLPRSCHGRDRSHSPSHATLLPHCRQVRRGFSMMDGLVRGSYDSNYAKSGS